MALLKAPRPRLALRSLWRNTPELSAATPAVLTCCCVQVVDLQPGSINSAGLELEEVRGERFINVNSPEASSCCFGA